MWCRAFGRDGSARIILLPSWVKWPRIRRAGARMRSRSRFSSRWAWRWRMSRPQNWLIGARARKRRAPRVVEYPAGRLPHGSGSEPSRARKQAVSRYVSKNVSTESYDVAVIGAGVFGAWAAYRLRRSGRSVALLDAYGAANSRASSGDGSR